MIRGFHKGVWYATAFLLLVSTNILTISSAPTKERDLLVETKVSHEYSHDLALSDSEWNNVTCTLIPGDRKLASNVATALDDDVTTLEFYFKFRGAEWLPSSIKVKENTTLFKPNYWVWSRGRFSSRFLIAKMEYPGDPFITLKIKDKSFKKIELIEHPQNCLDNISYDSFEQSMREMIINGIGNTALQQSLFGADDRVCNLHIKDAMTKFPTFEYYCCQFNDNRQLACDFLQLDEWFIGWNTVVIFIKLGFLLFCPLLIRLVIPLMTQREDTDVNETRQVQFEDRFIGDDKAPFGLFSLMYEYLIHCRLRELPSLEACCGSRFWPFCMSWYAFAKFTMSVIVKLCVLFPWYIYIAYYVMYEKKEIELRQEALQEIGNSSSTVQSSVNICALIIFMLMYFVLVIIMCIPNSVLKFPNIRIVIEWLFKDMGKNSAEAFSYILQMLIIPFKVCGCFGLIPFCIMLIVGFFFCFVYFIPTLNIYLKILVFLVIHFKDKMYSLYTPLKHEKMDGVGTDKKELQSDYSWWKDFIDKMSSLYKLLKPRIEDIEKIVHARIGLSFFLLLFPYTFVLSCNIATEIFSFFLGVCTFEFVGIIIYAQFTATYLTLLAITLFYGKSCFGSVSKRYQKFSIVVLSYIRKHHFADTTRTALTKQENRFKLGNGVMLRDSNGIHKIPSILFSKACVMNYKNSPGRPLHQYFKATLHFLFIILFLVFILLVVFTFGKSSEISVSNQLLLTISGGILPFFLQQCLFRKHEEDNYDYTNDTSFCEALEYVINEYRNEESLTNDTVNIQTITSSDQRPGEARSLHSEILYARTDNLQHDDENNPLVKSLFRRQSDYDRLE